MVTIYSIAERLGVSAATVSRALSRPELVSAPLRARILSTADAMGYQVNRSARRLARGRSGLVSVIVPDITNPYFPPLVGGLSALLDADGVSMVMVNTGNDPAHELTAIHRSADEVDGFILVSPRSDLRALQTALRGSRAVLVHRPSRVLHHVLADESAAIAELFERFAAGGRTRAAYLGGPSGSWVDGRRRAIAKEAAAAHSVTLVDLGAHEATLAAGQAVAGAVLDARVDAVLAFDDALALGLSNALAERGVSIPDELAIAAFDDLSYSALVRPAIASIAADPAALAAAAAGLLTSSVPGQLESTAVTVPARLHVRASLGHADA